MHPFFLLFVQSFPFRCQLFTLAAKLLYLLKKLRDPCTFWRNIHEYPWLCVCVISMPKYIKVLKFPTEFVTHCLVAGPLLCIVAPFFLPSYLPLWTAAQQNLLLLETSPVLPMMLVQLPENYLSPTGKKNFCKCFLQKPLGKFCLLVLLSAQTYDLFLLHAFSFLWNYYNHHMSLI